MSNADVFIVGVNVIIKHLHFALFAKTQIQIISNESMSVRNPRDSKLAAFDEVAWNQIWREQLRKEYEQESTLTPFQLNLKYLHSIPLKPTQVHPAAFAEHVQERQDGSEEMKLKLQAYNKKLNEKSDTPLTETQRIGWHHQVALDGVRREMQQRMYKGRGSCDVTKFASSYCAMAGCSPFAEKGIR
ncbi:unnamed protein product [Albugo candida]|uniref:Uncharacterized protein n=1 Tax=Albugo candida TaxID=65357 RepID=A0A024GFC2_9STRA|nr:unnamed protein product [Albugo candida]|eukprot:CCI45037.1 unnamed protein product [Albugo candida]